MSSITLASKCVKTPHKVQLYHNEKERLEARIPASTVQHNHVATMVVSRRNKITHVTDNMLDRKNIVRDRLLKKLAAKKAKNSQGN